MGDLTVAVEVMAQRKVAKRATVTLRYGTVSFSTEVCHLPFFGHLTCP
jgi:hypothetical protein